MQQAVTFPTFIIIGAERCGTTTVHHSLARHPQVLMSARKEPNYWLFDKHGRAPAAMTQQQIVAMEKRSGRTRRDYEKLFEGAGAQHIAIGEASPCYLRFPRDVAPRLRAELPEVKLITILRQPLDHARSVLAMWLGRSPSAAEMIDALHTNQRGPTGGPALPVLGRYADYLRPYFAVFPREQIKVLLFDRIESDLLSEVQTFLGVTPMKLPNLHLNCSGRPKYPMFGSLGLKRLARSVLSDRLIGPLIPIARGMQAANMCRVTPNLPPALQTALTEKFYGRSISDLESLIGLDLSAWRIQEGLATEPDRRLDQTFMEPAPSA